MINPDDYTEDEIKAIQSISELKAENEKLKKFLDWLFAEVFEGSPDGSDIQDKAGEMGILISVKVPEDKQVNYDACMEYETDEIFFPYWYDEAKGIFD